MTVRNLILNPRLNQNAGIELHNSVIRNTADTWAGSIDPQSKSWKLNLQCKDTTLDPVNPYAVLETDCTGLVGKTVIAAVRCYGLTSKLYKARTLMLVAYDQSNTMLGMGNYGQPKDSTPQLITLEWTVPANTSRLEYRLYTTIDGNANVWWAKPLLCTKTDWQKLAGYGLTYYNGDTMPNIG